MRFLGNNNIFRHGTPGHYSTNFEDNIEGKVEHFDVYGEVCKLNFRRREKLQTFSHCWFYAVQVQTMYSQVYWTRNNPIDLPPELVNSIGRKLFNTFPGKNPCKRNRNWPRIFSERKYFQKTNIFRDETFSDKNFSGETISRKGDGHHRLWSWSGASTITITISGKPTYQRNISQVTHTGDEKIKADSENSNEAGLSGFACYPDCSKSDKSVNKIKKKSFSKQTGEIMALHIPLICL